MLAKACGFSFLIFIILAVIFSFCGFPLCSVTSGFISFASAVVLHEELK